MKRIIIFLVIVCLLGFANLVISQDKPDESGKDTGERTKVLIDFTQFEANNEAEGTKEGGAYSPPTDKEKEDLDKKDANEYFVKHEDMGLNNWVVRFNSSSNFPRSRELSETKAVKTKDDKTVLGARIHFPTHKYYSHATIKPLYEIMDYNKSGILTNIGNGVIENVDKIKRVVVEVSGRNYNNKLFLRLIDQDKRIKSFYMGSLNFIGWRRLVWEDSYYISNTDQRDIYRRRIYPEKEPHYKFHSFVISRPEYGVRGDFVVYFRKVTINYDLSNVVKDDTIDDEKAWGIRNEDYKMRGEVMRKKHADQKYLKELERKKMGKNAKDHIEEKPKE